MPSNIEIKARVRDASEMRRRIRALSISGAGLAGAGPSGGDASNAGVSDAGVLEQTDTFFRCAAGRMKLREMPPHGAELIFYLRPDTPRPKKSDYAVLPVADPAHLRRLLEATHGILGVVRKRRELYLLDRVRIHLDRVEGLGDFLELEVILDRRDESQGVAIAQEIMKSLVVEEADLINVAYIDMIVK